MADEDICKTVNCHTEKLNNLITGVCDLKQSLYKQCAVIIGEGASGPDTSVVLGCDALGSDESVVVGNDATSQGNSRNVVVGYMANANNTDSVVIGHMAEGNTGSIVIGKDSVSSGNNSIVIGKNANLFEDNSILLDATDNDTSGKFYVKPVRELNAPNMLCYNTGTGEVSYQPKTDEVPDGNCYSDYLYWNTGSQQWENGNSDNNNRVHIGCGAGQVGQEEKTIAIGFNAGNTDQKEGAVAIGRFAGNINQSDDAIAIGKEAGKNNQSEDAIAIGRFAGNTGQNSLSIAIGCLSGYMNQEEDSIAFGREAGKENQKKSTIAIGTQAGEQNQGTRSISIGITAGRKNQGEYSIAIGNSAGNTKQGCNSIAIGKSAGSNIQKGSAIAIGKFAGNSNQGTGAIAIGDFAGNIDQETGAIAIGDNAGNINQKENSIAIGEKADFNGCNNNTIILNAQTNTQLDSTDPNSFYVKPVRELNAPNMLCYNTGTGEISYQQKSTFITMEGKELNPTFVSKPNCGCSGTYMSAESSVLKKIDYINGCKYVTITGRYLFSNFIANNNGCFEINTDITRSTQKFPPNNFSHGVVSCIVVNRGNMNDVITDSAAGIVRYNNNNFEIRAKTSNAVTSSDQNLSVHFTIPYIE